MSWLIIQSNSPDSNLAQDSYGVIATAAMFEIPLRLVYCNAGLQHLSDATAIEQLQQAQAFGLQEIFYYQGEEQINNGLSFPNFVTKIDKPALQQLLKSSQQVLTF